MAAMARQSGVGGRPHGVVKDAMSEHEVGRYFERQTRKTREQAGLLS
jgi:hypothetical protein